MRSDRVALQARVCASPAVWFGASSWPHGLPRLLTPQTSTRNGSRVADLCLLKGLGVHAGESLWVRYVRTCNCVAIDNGRRQASPIRSARIINHALRHY